MPLCSIAATTVERIFMKFSEKDGRDTGGTLKHFRDVTVNPLNPWSIYLFPGSVFVCNITQKRVNGFSWNFYETSGMTKKIATLFHTCLNCFTVFHLGAPDVFLSNTTVKSMRGFSWSFHDVLALTQGTVWKYLGMIGLTPWTQGSFLGPCLLATSRNTGWMDIHEFSGYGDKKQ